MSQLATLVLYAFNEEKFIKEAILSAFAQTYSPLEIVLSDDGSTDRTFAIMEEMARLYQGPHKIILNRNPSNIGIGSQLNAAAQKSQGDLILLANGDDVSLPERVGATVNAWVESGCRAKAITTDLLRIDAGGNPLPGLVRTETKVANLETGVKKRFGGVGAASLALSREVFDCFSPLLPGLILEDNALFMRAYLLGGTLHLQQPLVKYRIHPDNISQNYAHLDFEDWVVRYRQKAGWQPREAGKAYLQMLNDLYSSPAEKWDARDLKRARWIALEMLCRNSIIWNNLDRDLFVTKRDHWHMLGRLLMLMFRLSLKSLIPWIEHRNERWHYRQLQAKDRAGWR